MHRLLLLALLAASTASAQDSPFALCRARPGDGPLSGLLRLRDAETAYLASEQWRDAYAQTMAQRLALVGDHAGALRWADRTRGASRADSVGTLPAGTQALDALAVIAERAATTRVVIINEAHHDAASRLLTLRLLPVLYAQGYRYLAAEAFGPDVAEATRGGYPTPEAGGYVGEPVFGAVVREALRLGYTLVPYEIEDADEAGADTTLSRQQLRDSAQARHLAERTVERDPEARVLVHAGYGHAYETVDPYWHPMAVYFRKRTGIDPLTVDQTAFSERSEPAFELPRYRAADAAGLLGGAAIILADAAGQPLAPTYNPDVDLQVLTPRTTYTEGRPDWMSSFGYYPVRIRLPAECQEIVCVGEVQLWWQTRGSGNPPAVPLDITVASGTETLVYGPGRGEGGHWTVTILDGRTGRIIEEVFPPVTDSHQGY